MSPSHARGAGRRPRRQAQRAGTFAGRRGVSGTVRLAVALAFADASIVVLALPQLVGRLDTSISRVTWVIMAYNLALIVTAAAVIPLARRVSGPPALIAGLAVFGLASIGSGAAGSMSVLVPMRALQGVGGGLLLCASLPVLANTVRPAGVAYRRWSSAAAVGMAVGPAAGGVLTQIFDWRAIFFAQAPVAALGIILVSGLHLHVRQSESSAPARREPRRSRRGPLVVNTALALLSAGLIGALFLVVLLLIDVWQFSPITAALVVSTIPVATALAGRAARGRPPIGSATAGAVLIATGLVGLSLVTHRDVGWVIFMLALVGSGLGLAFPPLTATALEGPGHASGRAAKTVAARDAGIVIGLLILTPILIGQLDRAPDRALSAGATAVFAAPISDHVRSALAPSLLAAYRRTPEGQLPDLAPAFARASRDATPSERAALRRLHAQLDAIVQRAVTGAFRLPLRYGAVFAILVLPLLSIRLIHGSRTRQRFRARTS